MFEQRNRGDQIVEWWTDWIPGNLGVMAFASIPTAALWNLKVLHGRYLGDRWKEKVALIVFAVAVISPALTTLIWYAIDGFNSLFHPTDRKIFSLFWQGDFRSTIQFHNVGTSNLPGTRFALLLGGYTVIMCGLMFLWSRKKPTLKGAD